MRRHLLTACLALGAAAAGHHPAAAGGPGAVLSTDQPVLSYAVRDLDRSSGDRFVQVRVTGVVNPAAAPLAFTVHYQPPGGARLYLGGFALFPADNPGQFIVPTDGRVGCAGEILVSLEPIEDAAAARRVRVTLGDVRLAGHGR